MIRAFKRWWHRRRIAHWQAIVASIEQTEADIPAQLGQALRKLGAARIDLTFVDIERPPISRATGTGKRDGVDRGAALTTPFSRKVALLRAPHNATNQRGS